MELDDVIMLALRLGLVALLYLFLARVVAVLWRDLHRSSEPVMTSRQSAHLQVVQSGRSALHPGEVIPLLDEISLGRDPDNRLVIADESVSGKHALLRCTKGRWLLQDLGSTNGTRINGRAAAGSTQLRTGDAIEVGRVQLRFVDPAR